MTCQRRNLRLTTTQRVLSSHWPIDIYTRPFKVTALEIPVAEVTQSLQKRSLRASKEVTLKALVDRGLIENSSSCGGDSSPIGRGDTPSICVFPD